jgi:hypothetical protein
MLRPANATAGVAQTTIAAMTAVTRAPKREEKRFIPPTSPLS